MYKCLTKYTVSCSFPKRLRIFRHETRNINNSREAMTDTALYSQVFKMLLWAVLVTSCYVQLLSDPDSLAPVSKTVWGLLLTIPHKIKSYDFTYHISNQFQNISFVVVQHNIPRLTFFFNPKWPNIMIGMRGSVIGPFFVLLMRHVLVEWGCTGLGVLDKWWLSICLSRLSIFSWAIAF